VKLIRAATYEAYVLTRDKPPAPNADRDYLSLTGSIRADIQALWIMAKDGAPERAVPDLQQYLTSLREAGKLHRLERVDGPKS
jgi:hypothetical protein